MTNEITNAEKISKLHWNIALNANNSVFATLTFFGSSFVLFLSTLGLNNGQIGFLLSLLPFMGMIAVVVAPRVSRFGYKRTYVTFFGIRKFITMGLLFVPYVMHEHGIDATLTLVTVVVLGFAFCRAVADTAFFPWAQEFIPNSMRGKHAAINDMVSRIVTTLTIAFAGYVLALGTGLDRFMLLFAVAIAFGLLAVWSVSHLPGGAPAQTEPVSYRQIASVLKDNNFLLYMGGLALVTFANAPLGFLPLFMQNQVGLSESTVVWLQIGTVVGGFTATYLMGWAADRYGSKPVMLLGLCIKALLPIGWMLLPRHSDLSLAIALLIALVWGIAEIAWGIGSGRLLYVKVVPFSRKSEYMALYYALIGLVGGISQLVSGNLLDLFAGVSGQFIGVPLDAFTPLFIGCLVLTLVSIIVFQYVQADSNVSLGAFAGLFVHGNPLTGLESMIRYYRASDERATVAMTERMGQTRSPLTVDELLAALKDPRFNVRFEAIITIARLKSDPRLVDALRQILDGTELSLSVIAAWALGRMGDASALPTLRNGLNSSYRSIQAHCARSLGTLGDTEITPLLLERLQTETDKGLRIAYASALGNLQATDALDTLLNVLESTQNEGARGEITLALARLVGHEGDYIRLMRQLRQDQGTTTAQVLFAWRRKMDKIADEALKSLIDISANHFASNHFEEGTTTLIEALTLLPAVEPLDVKAKIRLACIAHLTETRLSRPEYLHLLLHTLRT